MNELHLFAGAGGGILGGLLLGHRPVCAVEIEPYPRKVLIQRQRDGILPRFPIWDDICTFDGKPWKGKVDVVCGGFPCQDISSAGKGAGIEGERSGLWGEMARVIGEVRPRYVFVENSPMLVVRGLGRVLGDLSEMGYNAKWTTLGADDVGAPHRRKRIWILAELRDSNENGESNVTVDDEASELQSHDATDTNRELLREQPESERRSCNSPIASDNGEKEYVSDALRTECESRAGRRGVRQGDKELADAMRNGSQGSGKNRETKGSIGLRNGERSDEKQSLCDPTVERLSDGAEKPLGESRTDPELERSDWWSVEPDVGRVAHGVASFLDIP